MAGGSPRRWPGPRRFFPKTKLAIDITTAQKYVFRQPILGAPYKQPARAYPFDPPNLFATTLWKYVQRPLINLYEDRPQLRKPSAYPFDPPNLFANTLFKYVQKPFKDTDFPKRFLPQPIKPFDPQYLDRKSTRLNSSHSRASRMPSSA